MLQWIVNDLERETVFPVKTEEKYNELIKSEKYIAASPECMAQQLFGYMSDNDDAQLRNNIEDFLKNPKLFVRYYLEDILEFELLMDSLEKYEYLHTIEGKLHIELMKRNLIVRAWVPNV